ncbi:hypothetical protein ACFQ1M_07940 [Sungkyunkwania multivorans]|uniref:Uncharacterized protein n=1 Tax=Sungkyunkwania multivorans TaxID=1173618 RepID=A0ABW3CX98_9FLAO
MRTILAFIILSTWLFACKEQPEYVKEPCTGYKEIDHTATLRINDTLPSFSGVTDTDRRFSLSALSRKHFFLFLKKNIKEQKPVHIGLLNEDVSINDLGDTAANKDVDLLIENDLKIAELFGLGTKDNGALKHNTLIITDKNKIIKKILIDICEDELKDIMAAL